MNLRRATSTLLLLTLVACGHKAPAVVTPPPPKPVVKKIAFLPVHEVKRVELVNRNRALTILSPIAGAFIRGSNDAKQPGFSEQFLALKPNLGRDLMASLKRALEQDGYEVVILDDVPRNPKDPEKLELSTIKTDADAILHVYIDEIGLYSENMSNKYLPRLNIRVELNATKIDEELYGEKLCWGIDAQPKEGWAIVADPKVSYASYDAVMTQLPEIANHFENATQALGQRMLARMKAELKP